MAAYKMKLPVNTFILDIIKSFCAAFIIRASACTVNDIFDRKMDAGVGQFNFSDYPSVNGAVPIIPQNGRKIDRWLAVGYLSPLPLFI
jgi:4-hydroxybenzoate polyprenyltransferase